MGNERVKHVVHELLLAIVPSPGLYWEFFSVLMLWNLANASAAFYR